MNGHELRGLVLTMLAIGTVGLAGCQAEVEPPAVSGHLVVVSRAYDNSVDRFVDTVQDLSLPDGTAVDWWHFDGQSTDWRVSPDGRKVAYAVSEIPNYSLIVRELRAESTPTEVATVAQTEGEFYGLAWSADSTQLAYGRQIGQLDVRDQNNPTAATGWELRAVDLATADDRMIWQVDKADMMPFVYRLEAWDSQVNRAIVSDRRGRSLYAHALRRIDTSTGTQLSRDDAKFVSYPGLSSRDGRWLALPESEPITKAAQPPEGSGYPTFVPYPEVKDGLRRLTLADGTMTDVTTVPDVEFAFPLWSPDGGLLAWMQVEQRADLSMPIPGGPTVTPYAEGKPPTPDTRPLAVTVQVGPADGGPLRCQRQVLSTGDRLVAFAPDGQHIAALAQVPNLNSVHVRILPLTGDTPCAGYVADVPTADGVVSIDWLP